MNLQLDLNTARLDSENHRLWQDSRVWFVNCVAIEAAFREIGRKDLPALRRRRDAILAAFIESW